MSWQAINFNWNCARAFLVTAEEGSLSAAARALGISQPTLSRQVAALEEELGVVLFERFGRGLALTPSGLDLMEYVRAMGDAANQFSLSASGQANTLEGRIGISATDVMAKFILPPLISELRRQEPGIIVELIASNKASDLMRREADIAIRAFQPTEPELIVKKLPGSDARLYASPDYLASIGHPTELSDFNQANFLGFKNNQPLISALNDMGFALTEDNFAVICDVHLVHWELVKHGAGIGIMPDSIGDAEPKVVRILPDLAPFHAELWLVSHRELRTSRRVRRVFDFLYERLQNLDKQ